MNRKQISFPLFLVSSVPPGMGLTSGPSVAMEVFNFPISRSRRGYKCCYNDPEKWGYPGSSKYWLEGLLSRHVVRGDSARQWFLE
jgi:hypothetical protein